MSQLLRTVTSRIIRNNNVICAPLCNYLSQSSNAEVSRTQDQIMQSLQSSQTTDQLLNAVARHLQAMNHKHLMQVLRSLFVIHKDNSANVNIQTIIRNPTFGSVCQAIKRNARALEVNECVEALKVLSVLKIPVETLLVQTILQMIRKNVNEFNIQQIMFIDFIISKYEDSNPLVDALKMALPLVFEIHLPLEMDHEDLPQLNDMLSYACTRGLPERSINNIVTGLLLHGEEIDHKTAKSIVWSLASINVKEDINETRCNLLRICFKIVTRNIEFYNFDDVLKLASKLTRRLSERHMEFYSEEFFDAFANLTMKESSSLEQTMLATKHIARVNHTNLEFVQYIFKLMHENLECIANAKPGIILRFVHCLSNANCELDPKMWKDISEKISKNSIMELQTHKLPYTKFTCELASLGYYDMNFLSKLYRKEFLKEYLGREEVLDLIQILHIHEAAKLFCAGYNLSPPEEVLKEAYEKYPMLSENQLLEGPLAVGLGGHEYYATNVQLPNGIIVDHIIALQDGIPMKILGVNKEGKTRFEQLKLPSSVVILCILKFSKICYSLNNDRLRGQFRLVLDILEAKGFPAVSVNVNTWMQMPEREQSPYLMREVRMKCKDMAIPLVLD